MSNINNKEESKLLWILSGRGFGSEFNNLLYAINYSRHKKNNISIYSEFWNMKLENGWLDFFLPNKLMDTSEINLLKGLRFIHSYMDLTSLIVFNKDNKGIFELKKSAHADMSIFRFSILYFLKKTFVLYERFSNKTIFNNFYKVREFNINQVKIDRLEFVKVIHKILLEIWQLKPEILEKVNQKKIGFKNDYAVLHIRRGDKVSTGEDGFYTIDDYINKLVELRPEIKTVFIMTDDYSAFEELRSNYKEFTFYTLASKASKGHNQADFNKSSISIKEENAVLLFTEIEIARESKIFIGSQKSNLFRLIEYFKTKNCFDISTGECDYII